VTGLSPIVDLMRVIYKYSNPSCSCNEDSSPCTAITRLTNCARLKLCNNLFLIIAATVFAYSQTNTKAVHAIILLLKIEGSRPYGSEAELCPHLGECDEKFEAHRSVIL
jgi:hypothetical protein